MILPDQKSQNPTESQISPQKLNALLQDSEFLLLDIRTPSEWQTGLIDKAVCLEKDDLEKKIKNLATDFSQKIVVYCDAGLRSFEACFILKQLGYENVSSLSGGIKNWKNQNYAIVSNSDFHSDELKRYDQQIRLKDIGLSGQQKLKQSRMLIVGMGGLGCPASLYLAAAGVGHLSFVDDDIVDASNLHRQILYSTSQIQQKKTACAQNKLTELNPNIKISAHEMRLDESNVHDLIATSDIIINGCDNFKTRYLLNDACYQEKKILVDGAVLQFEGRVSVYDFRDLKNACYRCVYPSPPPKELSPNCNEAGVLGIVPGLIGILQATEAMKLALNLGDTLKNQILVYNALSQSFQKLNFQKNSDCSLCGSTTN